MFGKFRAGAVNPLWSGRIRQLQGRSASTGELAEAVEESRDSDLGLADRGAKSLYLQSRTILSDASDAEVPEEIQDRWEKLQRRSDRIRCQATYWLGVISLEEQKPKLAEFYFTELLTQWPDSELAGSAQLQRARAYQAQGQREKALQQYRTLAGGGALAGQLEAKRLAAEVDPAP
ncbi:MAG: hypothetical protein GTO03_14580 [Planctomycetales bacterium]|nr:hypothetical protein [Planctomycetales bacterium]